MRRHAVVATLLALFGTPARAGEPAEITADRLRIDHPEREARFDGNVTVRMGVLEVRCDALLITYDAEGGIATLRATGGVAVTHGGTRATARTASLDARAGRLVLTGAPSLHRDGHHLSGRRIEVDLDSGRLEVREARGTFVVGRQGGE